MRVSCSTFLLEARLIESIIPNAMLKQMKAEAPWLSMGSVWPVRGPKSQFTSMCRKACPLMSITSPNTAHWAKMLLPQFLTISTPLAISET